MQSINLNGVAEDVGNVKTVIVFNNRTNTTTMSHELLYAMGLQHTFDNDAKHTFKLYQTDNIMDYSHQARRKRFTTTCWQWELLQKTLK